VVLRLLLRARRFRPVSLLIAAHRAERLADLIAEAPADVPVYAAGQAVLDAIAGFHLHRGILALGEGAPDDAPALLAGLPARALVLAASGVGNHDNIGGLFRNAAAFGADAVLLDERCCDPLYRKALRVSVGASLVVPWARTADPAMALEAAGFTVFALSPGGAMTLAEAPRAARTAVLLGSEGPGLPPEVLARTTTVRIPMQPGFDSLNVATTSGVALYHFSRDLERASFKRTPAEAPVALKHKRV
jgi:tRNA G18 (ribose-2'-O)-methylase SpoU